MASYGGHRFGPDNITRLRRFAVGRRKSFQKLFVTLSERSCKEYSFTFHRFVVLSRCCWALPGMNHPLLGVL